MSVPKFSFGNAADYSTLFGNLYNSAIAKQTAQSVADQNAMDSDTYNQWQQGMISDQDWLGYIAQRVQDTAGDTTTNGVKTHQHWVQMQREYTNSIADNQAKANYQAGGSINDYIAYLQNRLTGLVPDNQEYRSIANELMTMQDTRAQNDLSTGAQAIIDNIQAGKQSYKDLLAFYQNGLREVRSGNTTLYKDVQSKIEQTENQIKADNIQSAFGKLQYQYDAGQLTGSQVAAQLRSLANTYYKNDPTKYYTTLDQAIKMDKVGSAYIGAKKGSGRGRSGLGSGVKSVIDAGRANVKYLTDIAKQVQKGEPYITLPNGTQYANTPSLRQQLFQDYFKAADALAGTYRAHGKLSSAAQVQSEKSYFIRTYVQPSNDIAVADQVKAMATSATAQIEAALTNPDPVQALNAAHRIGMEFQAYAAKLVQTPTGTLPGGEATGGQAVSLLDQPTPKADAEIAAFGQLLVALSSPHTTRQDALDFIQKAAIGKLIPASLVNELVDKLAGPENPPASGALEGAGPKAAALLGLNSGGVPQAQLVATPDGIQTVPLTQGIVRDPQTGQMSIGGVPDLSKVVQKGQKTTQALIDVNGKPMPVTAILAPYASSDFLEYKNTSGRTITLSNGAKINNGVAIPSSALSDSVVQAAIAAQGITKQPADLGLWATMIPAYTDSTGDSYKAQAYIYDPATRTFYQNLPMQYIAKNPDGTVQIDNTGKPIYNYQSFATAAGVPLPYSGSHSQTVQANWNAGMYANLVPQPGTRGPGGQVTPNAHDYSTAYFDPSQDAVPDAVSNSQQSSQMFDNYVTAPAKMKVDKAKKAWADSALGQGSDSQMPPTPSMDGGLSQVGQLAAGAGLKLGGLEVPLPSTKPGNFAVPSPALPNFNTPTQVPGSALPTVQLPNPSFAAPSFNPVVSPLPTITPSTGANPSFAAPSFSPEVTPTPPPNTYLTGAPGAPGGQTVTEGHLPQPATRGK